MCGAPLVSIGVDELRCSHQGVTFHRVNGIWEMIAPDRLDRLRRFVAEYGLIRRREGRGNPASEYYRALPYVDVTGRFSRDWRIRAASFDCLLEKLVHPLERMRSDLVEPLRILDVGAGNGWMSNRLALRGHRVCAVDVRTDSLDGLGARVHYSSNFACVAADYDRLPFESASFDLVIFNAALHYSERYEATLGEAIRVLGPQGKIAVVDSPVYRSPRSGMRMVEERRQRFARQYGIASDALASENFLTHERMRQLSAACRITWTVHRPKHGLRWSARRLVAGIRNRRGTADFPLLEGRTHLPSGVAIVEMKPHRILQAVGRNALRLRFVLAQRHRLERPVVECFRGISLRISPGLFHPIVFRSGAYLAGLILDDLLPRGARVLDLGCGTGICGIAAALRGADVIAVDINPLAVTTTRQNAAENGVRIEALEADLFGDLGRFDVVLFNPPYYCGSPRSTFDLAWRSDDVMSRFSANLRQHLNPEGIALIVLSSDGVSDEYLRLLEASGYRLARVDEKRHWNETLTVFSVM